MNILHDACESGITNPNEQQVLATQLQTGCSSYILQHFHRKRGYEAWGMKSVAYCVEIYRWLAHWTPLTGSDPYGPTIYFLPLFEKWSFCCPLAGLERTCTLKNLYFLHFLQYEVSYKIEWGAGQSQVKICLVHIQKNAMMGLHLAGCPNKWQYHCLPLQHSTLKTSPIPHSSKALRLSHILVTAKMRF